jgi:hypothetical protein
MRWGSSACASHHVAPSHVIMTSFDWSSWQVSLGKKRIARTESGCSLTTGIPHHTMAICVPICLPTAVRLD